jgi:superfamily II DNA or RNA helicase
MERRPDITFDSYDRFFPSQDTIPKGGFGSLIALPLQGDAIDAGNTVFLDREGEPFVDQWAFLAATERVGRAKVEAIVSEAQGTGRVLGVRPSLTEFQVEDPWTVPPSGKIAERQITESLPKSVAVVVANMVYVDKTGLPPSAVTRIKRLASFQNPEFYRAQAMRMSTFGKPRVISCAEDVGRYIALPRGSIDELLEMFSAHGIEVSKRDERSSGVPLGVDFTGDLSAEQKKAVAELMKQEIGILSAATAFGKTVVAAWMIASRGVNTLVLVHRQQLMDQWRDRLTMFLAPGDSGQAPERGFVGAIGGGKDTRTGMIDIGMLQSLNRKGEVKDLVAEYGQIIADECHHIPAFSFERVLKKAKPRYVLGLTATPVRKDGHHPIIVMQCGPIRYRVYAKQEARRRPFEHVVLPRHTNFKLNDEDSDARIQDVYRALAEDEERNNMLFDDILKSLEAGRTPLVLTERVAHVNSLAERLRGFAKNVVVLKGGLSLKQRKELMKQLQSIPCGEERVIVSTGRYIGEGFDDGRLDTLFLAMPVSWRGTLEQYSGRLHRIHSSKKDVRIYDYVDSNVGVLSRMFKRRIRGYASLGYVVRHAQPPGDR